MIFVRGDRGANSYNSPATETVLRTRGYLYSGDQPDITVSASKFASVGNPYAASLDMRNITKTGMKDFFYLWDPNLSGSYGLGGYQTFSYNGSDYVITPGGGSYGASGSVSNFIGSGQAFFVQATAAGGNLTFDESAKTSGSVQVSRPFRAPGQQLRTNLYGVNTDGTTYIADGVLINYSDGYDNAVDDLDALKSLNSNENLSIKTSGNLLVVERRHSIDQQDTVFLNLTGERAQSYQFDIVADKLDEPGMTGYLEDMYLKTKTKLNLNGNTLVNFTIVNLPGSYAPNRFRIVFTPTAVLPLSITNVKASQQNHDIRIDWNVENEANVKKYEVERSGDGNSFTSVNSTAAKNAIASAYNWTDTNTSEGWNYYRIKSVDVNGKITYSRIVRVLLYSANPAITVFPNPVKGKLINLQLIHQPTGIYKVRLLTSSGQVLLATEITHTENSSIENIRIHKFTPKGLYKLNITRPDGAIENINLIY